MAIINNRKQYGVVHTTNVSAVRTGNMRAQYGLDATDFATLKAENGMLLVVDDFNKSIKLPTDIKTTKIYLVASEIDDYDGKGEANYALTRGSFLPRMLELKVDDKFETNGFNWNSTTYADMAALEAAIKVGAVYGETNVDGFIRIAATPTALAVTELKVRRKVMLPNGEYGLEFIVNKIG